MVYIFIDLLLILIASIVLICKSLWIKASAKCIFTSSLQVSLLFSLLVFSLLTIQFNLKHFSITGQTWSVF